jgi:hypothetical protein
MYVSAFIYVIFNVSTQMYISTDDIIISRNILFLMLIFCLVTLIIIIKSLLINGVNLSIYVYMNLLIIVRLSKKISFLETRIN